MNTLESVKALCQKRDRRARELRGEGKKIIGYLSAYLPKEIINAAGCVPYRILGDPNEPITDGDNFLEQACCPFVRSCFDIGVKGRLDFLDGFVAPHYCHNIEGVYDIWTYNIKTDFSHFIDVPHTIHPSCHEFLKEELAMFKDKIGEFAGVAISNQKISESILQYNENRDLFRQMYELRKQDPPLLSGSEVIEIIVAGSSMPVEEYSALLKGCIEEATTRTKRPERKGARVMVMGSGLDNPAFIELIEQCGANVVIDDLSVGTRGQWHDVEITQDPLDGLATMYLEKFPCSRNCRSSGLPPETRQDDLRARFGHILDFAHDFDVAGVIVYTLRYCDPIQYDVPDIEDYLREAGLPVLSVEDDYFMSGQGKLRTMIEAFLEMIER
ncbi:3-hydroxyacyl-ACP dehydratase [Desulfosarcina ovata subsp. sediminis]|uniref:3-hydroxyacyl-ACP dehydratase n=1 Tax=Desulfosarcina ovata subsp. sediminis TaxID=885957 RepID=A0A5K7ZNU2_9BACT|nr:2-hydroxyacyl-CoA dehydratase family protein [Desulfosarcina ovata]BBO82037.1 3-hydroxyacyl-ACP dehydratase [Desulfosarcina ovata subsp. sediminis]